MAHDEWVPSHAAANASSHGARAEREGGNSMLRWSTQGQWKDASVTSYNEGGRTTGFDVRRVWGFIQ